MDRDCHSLSTEGELRFGAAGSLVLHGLLLFVVLVLVVRHPTHLWPSPPYVPVDLILLGQNSSAPAGAVGPPRLSAPHTPKADAASPTDHAVSPRGTHTPEDALDARLKALARLKQPNQNIPLDNGPGTAAENQGAGNGGLSYSIRDYVRSQILRRWSLNLAKLGGRTLIVHLKLTMKHNGAITQAEVIGGPADTSSDAGLLYRDIAISARNAAVLASPILLPSGEYPAEMHFTIDLNPRDAQH